MECLGLLQARMYNTTMKQLRRYLWEFMSWLRGYPSIVYALLLVSLISLPLG